MNRYLVCLLLALLAGWAFPAVDAYVAGENDFISLPAVKDWLGLAVDRQGAAVSITKDATSIKLTVGSTLTVQNGKTVTLPVAPQEKDGVVYVTAVQLGKWFGVRVDWDLYEVNATLSCPTCAKPLVLMGDMSNSQLPREFLRAIFRGNVRAVVKYIELYPRLLSTTKLQDQEWLPLRTAIDNGQMMIVRLLFDKGVKIPTGDDKLDTELLFSAVTKQNTEILALLAQKGINLNVTDELGLTALHKACEESENRTNFTIVKWLVEHGANVNTVAHMKGLLDEGGNREYYSGLNLMKDLAEGSGWYVKVMPLFIAVKSSDINLVRFLIEHGASLTETCQEEKLTLLHVAVTTGSVEMMDELAKHGLSVNAATTSGYTPLHLACLKGDEKIVSWLLEHGAKTDAVATIPNDKLAKTQTDVKELHRFGTPLMFAVLNGDRKCIKAFQRQKVELTQQEQTALLQTFKKSWNKSARSTCLDNLRRQASAAWIYCEEHGGRFPKAEEVWKLDIDHEKLLVCPAKPELEIGYGYNMACSGQALAGMTHPNQIVLFADSNADDHLIRSSADFDSRRHGDGYCVVYASGQAEFIRVPVLRDEDTLEPDVEN